MIKHIIGFALFVFIVTCGVMVYAFLYTPPMPQIEEVKIPVMVMEPSRGKTEVSPLSYELKSFTVDLEKRQATVEVKLNWNSEETPPKLLEFEMGVTTAGRRTEGIELGALIIKTPFINGTSVTKTLTSVILVRKNFDPTITNYYGYVELQETEGAITPLVLIEKNMMAGAVPALVRHPLKK